MKQIIELTPKPINPVLEETVICCLQDNLAKKCGWLNHIFNKAQRLETSENNRQYYPAVLNESTGEYLSMFPDESLGNFAFFVIDDSQRITKEPRTMKIDSPFSCIVWGDTRLVSNVSRTELKESILKAFELPVKTGRMNITGIYERIENVYRGFSISEIKGQYLMQPYFGFRIEGTLTYYTSCV